MSSICGTPFMCAPHQRDQKHLTNIVGGANCMRMHGATSMVPCFLHHMLHAATLAMLDARETAVSLMHSALRRRRGGCSAKRSRCKCSCTPCNASQSVHLIMHRGNNESTKQVHRQECSISTRHSRLGEQCKQICRTRGHEPIAMILLPCL